MFTFNMQRYSSQQSIFPQFFYRRNLTSTNTNLLSNQSIQELLGYNHTVYFVRVYVVWKSFKAYTLSSQYLTQKCYKNEKMLQWSSYIGHILHYGFWRWSLQHLFPSNCPEPIQAIFGLWNDQTDQCLLLLVKIGWNMIKLQRCFTFLTQSLGYCRQMISL